MSLEEIDPFKAPFCSRTRHWTEGADHGAIVVGQDMSLLVIFASETSVVIFAAQSGTFSWPWIADWLGYPESLDEELPTVKSIHITLRNEWQRVSLLLTIQIRSKLTLTLFKALGFNGNHIIGTFSSVNTTKSGSLKFASSCVDSRRSKRMRSWKRVCSVARTALGMQW
jgi:hypothetical protein